MTTLCFFCNKPKSKTRKKYCSDKCNKRSWYLRNNPNTKSYFSNNPDFWKTETGIGFKWERYASRFLKAKHLEFNKGGVDLDWNGKKVDVKVCNLYKRKIKHGKPISNSKGWWVFNRNKEKPVDFMFCIALKDNKLFRRFLIPNNEFPKVGAVIGWDSKYNKFIV